MHTQVRELRSATHLLLDKPQTRLVTRGDCAFAVTAPNLWNNLPPHIRCAPSLTNLLLKHTCSPRLSARVEYVSAQLILSYLIIYLLFYFIYLLILFYINNYFICITCTIMYYFVLSLCCTITL